MLLAGSQCWLALNPGWLSMLVGSQPLVVPHTAGGDCDQEENRPEFQGIAAAAGKAPVTQLSDRLTLSLTIPQLKEVLKGTGRTATGDKHQLR